MAGLIQPVIGPEQVAQFLWDHICHDAQVLMNAVGKSLDDCATLMNLLMCNLMTPLQGQGLASLVVPRFLFVWVRLVICNSIVRLLLLLNVGVFSPLFFLLDASLRSVFRQSSNLSCVLCRFFNLLVSLSQDIFGTRDISSLILTMCSAHFIRLLTILPTMPASVPTSSSSFILLFSTLFTPGVLCCITSRRFLMRKQYL